MYDILIVGGGPGGMYASIVASLYNLKSCIIESSCSLGGQPFFLYPNKDIFDFPCFKKVSGSKITKMLNKQMDEQKNKKADVFLQNKIILIKKIKKNFKIFLKNGEVLIAKFIILASGFGSFEPRKVIVNEKEIIHSKLNYFFKSEKFYNDKNVVVLGGGDSALDWTIHLKKNVKVKNVYLVHRTNSLRARSDKIEKLNFYKVQTFLNQKIVEIKKKKIIIQNNEDDTKISIDFDEILVQYGINTIKNEILNIFPKMKIKKNEIFINKKCETSIKNVYAIGQVAKYDSKPNMIVISMSEAAKAVSDIFFHLKKVK